LRDYLYIPLGGSKGNKFQTYKNLLITMLLGGLWHGAAWTFIVWGGLHGIILIGYRALGLTQTAYRNISEKTSFKTVVSILIIFHLNCLTWIYFRASSIEQANAFVTAIVSSVWNWNYFSIADNLHYFKHLVKLAWFMVLIDAISWFQDNEYWVLKRAYVIRLVCFLWLSLSILLWGAFDNDEFIYFQF
jgi:alginate O-acetyltransferase complex protein AlgI